MKSAEREGIVLVIIWAVVAVALSFLAEARGNQTIDPKPFTEDVTVQLSTTALGLSVVGAAATDALDQRTEEITEANWKEHPKIKEIREIVSKVDAGIKKGLYKVSQRRFELCKDSNGEHLRRIAVDGKGIVVRYEEYRTTHWADFDFDVHEYAYNDPAGRLRFVLVTLGRGPGRDEFRLYQDETGKLLWRDPKPSAAEWPGAPQSAYEETNFARDFASEARCREIKPKSRRRTGLQTQP